MSLVGRIEPAAKAVGLGFAVGWPAPTRLALALALIGVLAWGITACGSGGGHLSERVIPLGQPVPKGGGVYFIGKPYRIGGVWYRPRENPYYDQVGKASWYGELFHGRRTANGEIYDMNRLTAAHPTLPLPIYARVTNLANGRTIVVRINDRGPYARDRIIDLSRRSAEVLGFRRHGTARVRVQYLARAPMNGDDSYERRYLASRGWMQFASAGKTRGGVRDPIALGSFAGAETLPAENPENLALAWQAPAEADREAPTETAMLGWQTSLVEATPRQAAVDDPGLPTGSTSPRKEGLLIQAGSFKSKENANRARAVLGAIAPVDIAEIETSGAVYFRVRVGPFFDQIEAEAALSRVTQAGYQGARIVGKN